MSEAKRYFYDGPHCRCGGSKTTGTLICRECEEDFASTIELACYRDAKRPMESRRAAAYRLLSMAARRTELMRKWRAGV